MFRFRARLIMRGAVWQKTCTESRPSPIWACLVILSNCCLSWKVTFWSGTQIIEMPKPRCASRCPSLFWKVAFWRGAQIGEMSKPRRASTCPKFHLSSFGHPVKLLSVLKSHFWGEAQIVEMPKARCASECPKSHLSLFCHPVNLLFVFENHLLGRSTNSRNTKAKMYLKASKCPKSHLSLFGTQIIEMPKPSCASNCPKFHLSSWSFRGALLDVSWSSLTCCVLSWGSRKALVELLWCSRGALLDVSWSSLTCCVVSWSSRRAPAELSETSGHYL